MNRNLDRRSHGPLSCRSHIDISVIANLVFKFSTPKRPSSCVRVLDVYLAEFGFDQRRRRNHPRGVSPTRCGEQLVVSITCSDESWASRQRSVSPASPIANLGCAWSTPRRCCSYPRSFQHHGDDNGGEACRPHPEELT